ncbi:MAG: hypothetical protein MEQ84_12380 [Mesorhizobium sp.]|nr:hypothetical protein [Mesorhizobium sp.]
MPLRVTERFFVEMTDTTATIAPPIRPAFAQRLFLVFLGLALMSGVISVAGHWLGGRLALGGHSAETTVHEIVLGNDVLAIVENTIRFEEARQSGVANRLDLYLHWPELEGYSEATRDAFNHADGSREIIFVTFHQRLMSRDMSGRYTPIYAALTEAGTPGPAGLEMRPFKPTAGYLDEVLAVGPEDGTGRRFVARCLTGPLAAESLAPCERDVHLGEGLSVNYRFPEHLLQEWQLLDAALAARFAVMLQSSE